VPVLDRSWWLHPYNRTASNPWNVRTDKYYLRLGSHYRGQNRTGLAFFLNFVRTSSLRLCAEALNFGISTNFPTNRIIPSVTKTELEFGGRAGKLDHSQTRVFWGIENDQDAADIESAASCSKDSVLGFSFQNLGLCTQPQGNGDLRHNRLGDIQGGTPSKNCAIGGWISTQSTKKQCLCASFNYNCSRNAESEARQEHVIPIRPKR